MVHKIKVSELTPGMYTVDMALSVAEFPKVYQRAGLISSVQEVERIVDKGFNEVFVDDEKSTVPISVQSAWADLIESSDSNQQAMVIPTPDKIHKNVEAAVTMYASAIETAEHLFSSVEKGKPVPVEAVYGVAESVVDSIMQDNMTLATISKLQAHDNYTFSHSVNVSVLATMFGRHLGLEADWLNQLAMAGLLHDIGKVVIPHKLLNTARPLKDNEFEIMKQHSLAGYEEIKDNEAIPKSVKLAVLEHHERYNGTGYPHSKKGSEISFIGRMMSLVDVYDALTSKRVYKPALIPYTAVSFLYSQRGQHFEPTLVDRFIQSVGIYPVGSVLSLSSGEIGLVYMTNPQQPLLPVIAVIIDETGAKCPLRMIDLSQEDAPKVKSCLEPSQVGINTSALLKACAWAQQAGTTSAAQGPSKLSHIPGTISLSSRADRLR